jgi:hypothetical protein
MGLTGDELDATGDELDATGDELDATGDELDATGDELDATSGPLLGEALPEAFCRGNPPIRSGSEWRDTLLA